MLSGWILSPVVHAVLLLVMTLLMVRSKSYEAPADFLVVTPAVDVYPEDFFERASNRDIFWKPDPGEDLEGARAEIEPQPDELLEPQSDVETPEELEEPNPEDQEVPEAAVAEADFDVEAPPLELVESPGQPRPAPREVAGAEEPAPPVEEAGPAEPVEALVRTGEHVISPAKSHSNLTVFLITGSKAVKGRKFLTLQEALRAKKVVVRETGEVSELTIENRSPTEHVFVQAGDLVKGGKQDRVIVADLVLAPKSGPRKVKTFCVESGRWAQRGGEDAGKFSDSRFTLATRDLKLAARKAQSQEEVWKQVAATQKKLAGKLGGSVRSEKSGTSLQLTLEDPKVRRAVEEYVSKLGPAIKEREDAVGFAFAVNGKVSSAEIYASPELFRKQWPKLLEACAVEAVAEKRAGTAPDRASAMTVRQCIEEVRKGRMTAPAAGEGSSVRTWESRDGVFFETRDPAGRGGWIHRSYIAKRAPSEPGSEEAATPSPASSPAPSPAPAAGPAAGVAAKVDCASCRDTGKCAACAGTGKCRLCNRGPRMLLGVRPPCETCSHTGVCPACRGSKKCRPCLKRSRPRGATPGL